MAKSVYIAALDAGSGKTLVALGVTEVLSRQAGTVGVFRPVVRNGDVDDRVTGLLRKRFKTAATGYGVDYEQVRADPDAALSRIIARYHEAQTRLLDDYLSAFEAYDLDRLTSLLHDDATLSMPPWPLWLRGHEHIKAWQAGPGIGCRGSRLLPIVANGTPGFGQYRPTDRPGRWEPWAIQVIEIRDGRISSVNNFFGAERLFPLFGLPPHLEGAAG